MAAFLGIDIREHEVLGVLIKTNVTGRAFQSVRYLREGIFPSEAPLFGEITADGIGEDPVRAAVARLLAKVQREQPDVSVALSGLDGALRRVAIPVAAQKKLEELLPFEIESLLPFDLDEGVLDHQSIGISDGKVHVLAVALPKSRIEQQLMRWQEIGLDPERLSLGGAAFAGLGVVSGEAQKEGALLIANGFREHVDLAILKNGVVEFARSFRARDLSSAGAFSAMNENSDTPLLRDVRQSLIAARTQAELIPSRFLATGTLAGQNLSLAAALGLEPALLELPKEKLGPKSNVPSAMVEERHDEFLYALSLAALPLMKGRALDFRKGDFKKQKSGGVRKQYGMLTGAACVAVLLSFFYSTAAKWWALSSRRNDLAAQLASVTREVLGDETSDVAEARRLLETGRERVDPLPAFTAYDALQAISNAVPSSIVGHNVQKLEVDLGDDASGGHFELSGTVATIEESERIRNAITPDDTCLRTPTCATRCFRDVEMGPSTQTPDGKRLYRLEGTILCPEQAARRPTKNGRNNSRAHT